MTQRPERGELTRDYLARYPAWPERDEKWHPAHPVAMSFRAEREVVVARAIDRIPNGLVDRRVLEVGCGTGIPLRFLVELGLDPQHAFGIDVMPEYVQVARRANPAMDIRIGDAADGLPWPDEHFDVVAQFVALSSVPGQRQREQIANEMSRVCRTGGFLLWYELVRKAPGSVPDGIPVAELAGLFPTFRILSLDRLHPVGCYRLARFPFLRATLARLPLIPRRNVVVLAEKTGRG